MTRHVLTFTAVQAALRVPHHSISAAKPGNVAALATRGGGCGDAFEINNDPGSIPVGVRSTRADSTEGRKR